MTIDPFVESQDPGPAPADRADAALEAQANAALELLLKDQSEIVGAINETVRADVHLKELQENTLTAEEAQRTAEQRDANLRTRHDPAGYRILGFAAGAALVAMLVVLDAIPLNWASQAFGLDSGGTWLVTFILVVASVGAMLGFELTSGHPRQRNVLAAVVTAAYLALLGLRTEFLTTVSRESFPVALFQSAILTAISAGLVLCGSAVLARTRSLTLSRSRAAVLRTRQAAVTARAAQRTAADKLRRHVGGLRQMLLPWALSSAAPQGVDRATWAAALQRAVSQLFPES
jgi:hypothetical protein